MKMSYLKFCKIYLNKVLEIVIFNIYFCIFIIELVYYILMDYIMVNYLKIKFLAKKSFYIDNLVVMCIDIRSI